MILIDPSELREESRLPARILTQTTLLPGLEERTGADILLSPLSMPATSDYLLRQHCEAGALVQRKSGLDLTGSITSGRLTSQLQKMLEWNSKPWLVVCATITADKDTGVAVIDGHSSLAFNAVTGAFDFWQLRGGYLTILPGDEYLTGWIGNMLDRLRALQQEPVKRVFQRQPAQVLLPPDQSSTLATLPGIGQEKASTLIATGETLAWLLTFLCDETMEVKLPGIGPGTIRKVREWMGLYPMTTLTVIGTDKDGRV